MLMARKQTLVQLTPELLEALDGYVARTGADSRSEVIRAAIERMLAEDREAQIDRAIVDGYSRHPATDLWADLGASRLIEAEPW
jgi:metal-responsive CopG/Arc/MetJ family transcriptional regulator